MVSLDNNWGCQWHMKRKSRIKRNICCNILLSNISVGSIAKNRKGKPSTRRSRRRNRSSTRSTGSGSRRVIITII